MSVTAQSGRSIQARPQVARRTGPFHSPYRIMGLLVLILIGSILLSLNMGVIRLSPGEVFQTIIGEGTNRQELILFRFRLPRICMALLVGAALAVSGTIMQGVTQNGLADPGLLGVNNGAGLGVIVLLSFYTTGGALPNTSDPAFIMPVAALLGAVASALVVFGLAYKNGTVTPSRLLLVGIAQGYGIGAVTLVLSLLMPGEVYRFTVSWLAGTIGGTDWKFVYALLPWIVVLIPLTLYKAQTLNIMNLGDATATGLGVHVFSQRNLLLLTAVALAGASVAVSGGIGFLGLIGPHLGRRLVGPNHRVLLPVSFLIGSILLVLADIVARQLIPPLEIPVGIVVAAIGAPYFLYLLVRSNT